MDFKEDIRQFVLANLPFDTQDRAELEAMDAYALLVIYCDWERRFVPATPQKVHRSLVLDANPYALNPLYKPALDHIVESLKDGIDIGRHLSKGIMVGYESPSRLAQKAPLNGLRSREYKRGRRKTRRDLDLLLNDWGIHHRHLSTRLESNGWIARTGPVLFAVFKPHDAYLIDIAPHGSWYEEGFIRTIATEWPEAEIVREAAGITIPPVSSEQLKNQRGNYAVTGIMIDGRLYFPTSSLMTSGHSEQSVDASADVFRAMVPIEQELSAAPERIAAMLTARGMAPPLDLDIHFEFFPEGGYGVVERKTGTRFPLPWTS